MGPGRDRTRDPCICIWCQTRPGRMHLKYCVCLQSHETYKIWNLGKFAKVSYFAYLTWMHIFKFLSFSKRGSRGGIPSGRSGTDHHREEIGPLGSNCFSREVCTSKILWWLKTKIKFAKSPWRIFCIRPWSVYKHVKFVILSIFQKSILE